jgi:hypothetical protein
VVWANFVFDGVLLSAPLTHSRGVNRCTESASAAAASAPV